MKGPSLPTLVRRALEGEARPPDRGAIVVAVSGGPDSIALLHVLAQHRARARGSSLELFAHGVDHGLRPSASQELDLAERVAAELDVPFTRTRVRVPQGGNLQARARAARWEALVAAARPNDAAVATAHHADDRAETLLLRMLRGAGMRGLAVLPARATAPGADDVVVLRPLLRATRSDIMAHVARHELPYATDPSNADPRYLRTQVRTRLLPLLAELDPRIVSHLAMLADELVDGADPTQTSAPRAIFGPDWTKALPRPTQVALAALMRSRSPTARVWLPGGLIASIASPSRLTHTERSPRPKKQTRPASPGNVAKKRQPRANPTLDARHRT